MYRLFLVLLCLLFLLPETLTLNLDSNLEFSTAASTRGCDGSLGNCDLGSEFLMDSEISRRILASSGQYVSYGALSANRVPCSSAGRSYYNCQGSGPANPYSRGCSKITRCQRNTS